jgi:GntR family transcriptional repressor for pyruvate dehydrogenase complex
MSSHLTSTLTGVLRSDIVDGRIAPGDRLPSESTLIARHGVSRTVVREAIARLQAEGLIHTRRGSGSFALTPPPAVEGTAPQRQARTLAERRQLLEYRMALECESAALAAVNRTPAHLEALESALINFEAAGSSPSAALGFDYAFHLQLAEASGNPYLIDALRNLGPVMISMPRSRLSAGAPGTPEGPVSVEHRAVYDAVASGDAVAAAAAMRVHLTGSRRRLEAGAGASGKS